MKVLQIGGIVFYPGYFFLFSALFKKSKKNLLKPFMVLIWCFGVWCPVIKFGDVCQKETQQEWRCQHSDY